MVEGRFTLAKREAQPNTSFAVDDDGTFDQAKGM